MKAHTPWAYTACPNQHTGVFGLESMPSHAMGIHGLLHIVSQNSISLNNFNKILRYLHGAKAPYPA